MRNIYIIIALFILPYIGTSQIENHILLLNGTVDFEQTIDAFPPNEFTRKIPVPGLIDLAEPKIEQYELYFSGQHEPRYNWYRFQFNVDSKQKGEYAILKVLKSRYNTLVMINGHDCGSYMQSSVPIDVDLTPFLKYGEKNELLLRLGERAWMPKEAATGFDREKYTDIPGIWDDIFIEFGGPVKVHRGLALPSLKDKSVTAKINLENYAFILERNMEYSEIEYRLKAFVREKKSKKIVSKTVSQNDKIGCQQAKNLVFDIEMNDAKPWSPDSPFLYELVVEVTADRLFYNNYGNKESSKPTENQAWLGKKDTKIITFGMRDFESVGKAFHLNGKPINLFGSTLTLNRFFEDRDRANLPWDREWVEKMMIDIPKAMRWNFFRVSIGLLPEFWYDLADKHGIMIQNEYLMWNLRGRPTQYEKEYTDWIWQDGNHPSIIIWDALNEQKQDYIGRILIPKLKKLDHTRIWDLGYMKSEDLGQLEINEIHWYPLAHGWWVNDDWVKNHVPRFRFGSLSKKYDGLAQFDLSTTPIIVNEFGWLWQSRNGKKSGIRTYGNFTDEDITPYKKNYESYEPNGRQLYKDRDTYEYFLGKNATVKSRRDFQAYMLAIESEILRSTREADGLATFAYLSNNNGYTGDWFADNIKDLQPTPALLVQYHTCRPFAVFIDMQDGRYLKNPDYFKNGEEISLNLLGLNDDIVAHSGKLVIDILNTDGNSVYSKMIDIEIDALWQNHLNLPITLPNEEGGYMIITKLMEDGLNDIPQISRRYINIGSGTVESYPEYEYLLPKEWPLKK